MDPVSVIGAAASVGGLIDVVSKSIKLITELRGQWKDADLGFVNLASQLVVLKAGLLKVKEWTEVVADEAHHQLVMDLDSVLLCCGTLVGRLTAQLGDLRRNQSSSGQLSRLGKIRLVLGGRNMEEIQKMIERQVSTLNLLLNACSR
jgi:hypothetical protein